MAALYPCHTNDDFVYENRTIKVIQYIICVWGQQVPEDEEGKTDVCHARGTWQNNYLNLLRKISPTWRRLRGFIVSGIRPCFNPFRRQVFYAMFSHEYKSGLLLCCIDLVPQLFPSSITATLKLTLDASCRETHIKKGESELPSLRSLPVDS